MSILFQCGKCQQRLEVEDNMSGLNIDCPKCGNKLLIGLSLVPEPPPPVSRVPPTQTTPSLRNETSGPPETSGLAVASMVLGILAMAGGWFWSGVLLPLLALIFGHISLFRILKHRPRLTGKGFAVTGLVLGYTSLAIAIVVGIAVKTAMTGLDQKMKEIEQSFKKLSQPQMPTRQR